MHAEVDQPSLCTVAQSSFQSQFHRVKYIDKCTLRKQCDKIKVSICKKVTQLGKKFKDVVLKKIVLNLAANSDLERFIRRQRIEAIRRDLVASMGNSSHNLNDDEISALAHMCDRDITSEDFSFLARLDESVNPSSVISKDRVYTVISKVDSFCNNEVSNDSSVDKNESYPQISMVECYICLEPLQSHLVKVNQCGHLFHEECLTNWLCNYNNICPLDGIKLNESI